MPKKGNVKKNVSKQVKKLNNKGGGFKFLRNLLGNSPASSDSRKSLQENQIMIEYDKKLLTDIKLLNYWENTQKLKNLKGEVLHNDDYIDTFLSKTILEAILEVLKSHTNFYNSIELREKNKTQSLPGIDKDKLFSNKYSTKNISIGDNIKSIFIDEETKKNTFAIIDTDRQSYGNESRGDDAMYTVSMKFPTELIFNLTPPNKEVSLRDLEKDISKFINLKINNKIIELESNDSDVAKKIKEIESKRERAKMDEKERLISRERELELVMQQEREKNIEEIKLFLLNLKELNSKINIEDLIKKNIRKNYYCYLFLKNIIEKNINERNSQIVSEQISQEEAERLVSEELKTQTERGADIGGKKHSKREVLGKMMVIYKINGDRKEYVRHKGKLITIKDYKASMKQKAKKKI